MLLSRLAVRMVSVGLIVTGGSVAIGQDYPDRPVRIVTTAPGGGSDLAARLVAQGISAPLGQQVIVDNRAGGVIPGQIVSQAPPDGYTLLVYSGTLWIEPLLQKVPYDPVRDFSPIALLTSAPNLVVVHPSLPIKSIKELIALAKARPGELDYGSSASGSSTHVAAELFKSMAGVKIVRVFYKSAGQAYNDLVGGHVQLMFAVVGSVAPHVKAGRLRALAVTTAQPTALVPGMPTVAASGVPDYESKSIIAMFGPAKMPSPIISRLNQETVRVLNRADVREKFFNLGVEAVGSSPDELATTMKSEMARLGKVIKEAGIQSQ